MNEVQSQYDQAFDRGASESELDKRRATLNAAKDSVTVLDQLVKKAGDQRKEMEAAQKRVTVAEDKAKKLLDAHQETVKQLNAAAEERHMNFGKQLLTMPVLDAFNGTRPGQLWLPQLPWNNNFRQVARFDRCTTCHLGMERSLAGEPSKPAFPKIHTVAIELATPNKDPNVELKEHTLDEVNDELQALYGFKLAEAGIFEPNDVTISAVYITTPAATAGLLSGDVIEAVGDAHVHRPIQTGGYFLQNVQWGKPLKLTIRRGVPEPYISHPRLDLFVGPTSPHPLDRFGCTICHQGQGSETAFKMATHTPDNLKQASLWGREYGWFNNEDWNYPMFSHRFEESGCLKCHHEVVDLEPSRKFPEPPAPKLVEGYEVIRRYGCFGCHEINGYGGPNGRVGPDMRLEPQYYAAGAQLLVDSGLARANKQAVTWAKTLETHPENDAARKALYELVVAQAAELKKSGKAQLDAASLKMESVLKEVDNPGTLRKVGPSLRHVKSKVGYDFLTDWIANPRDFRPDTRMPRFFGNFDHLAEDPHGLEQAKQLEPIEIRAAAEYLLTASQPFTYLEPPAGMIPANEKDPAEQAAAVTRGKAVFELRGCLACHKHSDFPKGAATQGPDLSRIGAKLATNPNGRKWLYSWVRAPNRYHLRTVMPHVFYDDEVVTDAKGVKTDPADDATQYLMTSQQGWKPSGKYPRQLDAEEDTALGNLALEYLKEKFPIARAKEYLQNGIPAAMAPELTGDESALVNPDLKPGEATESAGESDTDKSTTDKSTEPRSGEGAKKPAPSLPPESAEHREGRIGREMYYVGRRTIAKYGCYACHDIPGYEDARPIGTALADWGRKDPSRLAFEHIAEYVKHGKESVDDLHLTPDEAYFTDRLLREDRIGFLWQKLHAPRSYDFKKIYSFDKPTESTYNQRLRMPKFTFAVEPKANDQRLEAVMTFILGLVAEPPPAAYVANPGPSGMAIVQGRKQIEQFNCTGCHTLEMDRWDIEYQSGDFGKPPTLVDYPFLAPHFTPEEIKQSKVVNRARPADGHATGHAADQLSKRSALALGRGWRLRSSRATPRRRHFNRSCYSTTSISTVIRGWSAI